MPYSLNTEKGFITVWKDILLLKIEVLYDLSFEQNVDFKELLLKYLPESFKFKDLWEKDYINI